MVFPNEPTEVVVDQNFAAEVNFHRILRELIKEGDVDEYTHEINQERLLACLRGVFYAPDPWNRHGLTQEGTQRLVQRFGQEKIKIGEKDYLKSDLVVVYWGSKAAKCVEVVYMNE
ncbi:hypothetical protein C9374_012233 [Naegleria lovaniensis]|uniref:Uncharacterized protein n=1 Tax=Naegleria lovaniensis TaxID=51637 RepID=A0AA88G8B8_NAELO|nr:uncharacterized protein C9374_012233 [Naegleria lovaniensis]KAG2373367.1 hypothetical protein C9374_012233 [Naegleria lovaniensis]